MSESHIKGIVLTELERILTEEYDSSFQQCKTAKYHENEFGDSEIQLVEKNTGRIFSIHVTEHESDDTETSMPNVAHDIFREEGIDNIADVELEDDDD